MQLLITAFYGVINNPGAFATFVVGIVGTIIALMAKKESGAALYTIQEISKDLHKEREEREKVETEYREYKSETEDTIKVMQGQIKVLQEEQTRSNQWRKNVISMINANNMAGLKVVANMNGSE